MVLVFLIILLAPVLLVLFMKVKYSRKAYYVNRVPGPKTLPLLGNAHQTGKTPSEILDNLFAWWQKYDKANFRIWIGQAAYIFVSNPKDVEFILTSNTLIEKSDIYHMLHPWLGTGLLTSHGSKWHRHRKMITPAFHFRILQNFHLTMNDMSTKFIEKLRQVSADDAIFDFQHMVHYFTLDVICVTAMGVNINAMDDNDAEIVKAFKDMCYNINMRAYHPLKRNNTLYSYFPEYSKYKKTLQTLRDFTNNVIDKRIKARENIQTDSNRSTGDLDEFSNRKMAFLDTLLTATLDDRSLTQEEIYEEVSTFMFAGHDTTTSGIAFTIYMISRHPHIQQKLYAEQREILGGNLADLKRNANFQEIANMKYLDLVIKEAQRLYPSVPIIARCTDKDYNINGTFVPKDTTLNVFIMALGYNENSFSDPYTCKPERFDIEQNGKTTQNPFEYVPFSAGPRNCVGQKFALLELKTVISKIVRSFEILPPLDELISTDGSVQYFPGLPKVDQMEKQAKKHKYDPILSTVLTLKSENGIHIRLRERN